jgi:hypothetical protein
MNGDKEDEGKDRKKRENTRREGVVKGVGLHSSEISQEANKLLKICLLMQKTDRF